MSERLVRAIKRYPDSAEKQFYYLIKWYRENGDEKVKQWVVETYGKEFRQYIRRSPELIIDTFRETNCILETAQKLGISTGLVVYWLRKRNVPYKLKRGRRKGSKNKKKGEENF